MVALQRLTACNAPLFIGLSLRLFRALRAAKLRPSRTLRWGFLTAFAAGRHVLPAAFSSVLAKDNLFSMQINFLNIEAGLWSCSSFERRHTTCLLGKIHRIFTKKRRKIA